MSADTDLRAAYEVYADADADGDSDAVGGLLENLRRIAEDVTCAGARERAEESASQKH